MTDIIVRIVNLMNASRAAGFCRGCGLDDEPDNKSEAEALDKAKSALNCLAEDAFEAGWRAAAEWANRDDLNSDIGSPAYMKCRDAALTPNSD